MATDGWCAYGSSFIMLSIHKVVNPFYFNKIKKNTLYLFMYMFDFFIIKGFQKCLWDMYKVGNNKWQQIYNKKKGNN